MFLPIAAAFLGFEVIRRRSGLIRMSILWTLLLWACYAVAVTEVLNLLRLVTRPALAAAWLLACATLTWMLKSSPGTRLSSKFNKPAGTLSGGGRMLFAAISCVGALIALGAVLSPPNTYDAAAYHLPRAMMWLQNRSVAPFVTPYSNMTFLPPANEFFQLHFLALEQGDVLANCTQWVAWLGCVLAVSLAAGLLGGDQMAQLLAALFAASVPEGVLEASGSKNDYSLCLWLATFTVFGLAYRREASRWNAAGLCFSAALAVLTKSTSWLLLPALAASLAVLCGGARLRTLPRHAWAGALLALILIAPFHLRNQARYGNPLSPPVGSGELPFSVAQGSFSSTIAAANLVRNLGTQFGGPWPAMNRWAESEARGLIKWIGEDPDAHFAIWPGSRFTIQGGGWHEASRTNFVHLLLYLTLAGLTLVFWKRCGGATLAPLWLALGLGFILFSGYLRWQPWHTRLHLPFFVLAAVPAGVAAARLRWPWMPSIALLLLAPAAIHAALWNDIRPLLGDRSVLEKSRVQTLFNDGGGDGSQHRDVVSRIVLSQCRRIGLSAWQTHFFYPSMALLGVASGEREVRFMPDSGQPWPAGESFEPCAVWCLRCSGVTSLSERYSAQGFQMVTAGADLLFLKGPAH
ncbi:MAG: hypothetical protein HZB13_03750 [Acidobacteria bacterium]|nr:hypothetical protein [Acidobacteriota bacterium]